MSMFRLLADRDELIDLHDKILPCNCDYSLFLNALNFALLAPKTPTRMHIYAFGSAPYQYYVAVHEPNICLYPSLSGHHWPTLKLLIHHLFNDILPKIAPDCPQFILDSDENLPPFLEGLSSHTLEYTGLFRRFYMSNERMDKIREMTITAPDGYSISDIDAESEFEEIHDAWAYGESMDKELTRQQLLHLPSSCIRNDDGSLASWEMSHHFMEMSHQFTYPVHRGKGLGTLSELLIAQRYIELGYLPCKGVSDANPEVLRSTRKSPYWTEGGHLHSYSVLRRD